MGCIANKESTNQKTLPSIQQGHDIRDQHYPTINHQQPPPIHHQPHPPIQPNINNQNPHDLNKVSSNHHNEPIIVTKEENIQLIRDDQLNKSGPPSWNQDPTKFLNINQQEKNINVSPQINIVVSSDKQQQIVQKQFSINALPLHSKIQHIQKNGKHQIYTIHQRSNEQSKVNLSPSFIPNHEIQEDNVVVRSDVIKNGISSMEITKRGSVSQKIDKYGRNVGSILEDKKGEDQEDVQCKEEQCKGIQFKIIAVQMIENTA